MKSVVYQKKVRSITKDVTLLRRYWENKNGISNSFRARIWQPKFKKYAYIKLDADNESDAINETLEKWSDLRSNIKQGIDIAGNNRKLETYTAEFVDYQNTRAKDKQISEKRVQTIGHHLVCLVKFWEQEDRPTLDELARLYEYKWQNWRAPQRAQKTGKIITARTRNGETQTHKMFFRWCAKRGYCTHIPEVEGLKVERTNEPFPQKYYRKLLQVARKECIDAPNSRIAWERHNYRYVIITMNGIGCRVLECKNMRWKDIDVRDNGVFMYIHGKGKERTIRIPDRIHGHLMDLLKWKKAHYPNYNEQDFPHIFNTYGSPKATNHYDGNIRRRWMAATGMPNPNDYELVCFRHKFITGALRNGAHSLTIATYCGTSQKMIEMTYSGLVPAQVYDLVFENTPEYALSRNDTPEWMELGDED